MIFETIDVREAFFVDILHDIGSIANIMALHIVGVVVPFANVHFVELGGRREVLGVCDLALFVSGRQLLDDPVVGDLIVLPEFLIRVFPQFLLYFRTVACVFNYHILDFDVSSLRDQIVDGNVNRINPLSFCTLRGPFLLN